MFQVPLPVARLPARVESLHSIPPRPRTLHAIDGPIPLPWPHRLQQSTSACTQHDSNPVLSLHPRNLDLETRFSDYPSKSHDTSPTPSHRHRPDARRLFPTVLPLSYSPHTPILSREDPLAPQSVHGSRQPDGLVGLDPGLRSPTVGFQNKRERGII